MFYIENMAFKELYFINILYIIYNCYLIIYYFIIRNNFIFISIML